MRTFLAFVTGFCVLAGIALGQVPDATATLPATSPEVELIEAGIGAIARREWNTLLMVALGAFVFLLRTYGGRIVEALRIDTHIGGLVTNFLVAFAGVYTVALKLGQPLDLHLFLLAGGTSLGAAGGWHAIVKPFLDWRERRKSPVAARRAKAIRALEDLPDTATVADEHAAVQLALGVAP